MNQSRCLQCNLRHDVALRPGFIGRVGHMFSERGINIDEIAVYRRLDHTVMAVCFQANEQQVIHLQRRLQRFDGVTELVVLPEHHLHVTCQPLPR